MWSDFDPLFDAAAAGVSGVAVVVFLADLGFLHSPVSRWLLVVAYVAGVFAVSQATTNDRLTLWGYVVLVLSTVALLLAVTGTLAVGLTGRAIVLFVLALVLFDLSERVGTFGRIVSGRRATQAFAVLAVLAAIVVTADVVSGGLAHELRTEQEIHVVAGSETAPVALLGEIVVTNPGPLPQRVDIPRYSVCPAGNWSAYRPETANGETRPVDVHLQADGYYGEYVPGFGEHRYAAVLLLDAENVDGEWFPVQRTGRCPDDESGDPYLAVFVQDETEP